MTSSANLTLYSSLLCKRRTQRNNSCARCVQSRSWRSAQRLSWRNAFYQNKGVECLEERSYFILVLPAVNFRNTFMNKQNYLFILYTVHKLTYLPFFTVPYQLSSVETCLRDCVLDKKFSTVVKCSPIIRVISW